MFREPKTVMRGTSPEAGGREEDILRLGNLPIRCRIVLQWEEGLRRRVGFDLTKSIDLSRMLPECDCISTTNPNPTCTWGTRSTSKPTTTVGITNFRQVKCGLSRRTPRRITLRVLRANQVIIAVLGCSTSLIRDIRWTINRPVSARSQLHEAYALVSIKSASGWH
jgi:hypothetical protein